MHIVDITSGALCADLRFNFVHVRDVMNVQLRTVILLVRDYLSDVHFLNLVDFLNICLLHCTCANNTCLLKRAKTRGNIKLAECCGDPAAAYHRHWNGYAVARRFVTISEASSHLTQSILYLVSFDLDISLALIARAWG